LKFNPVSSREIPFWKGLSLAWDQAIHCNMNNDVVAA